MTPTRLIAAALLLGSVSASAQSGEWSSAAPGNLSGSHPLFFWASSGTAATPLEPWRVVPSQPTDPKPDASPHDRVLTFDYKAFHYKDRGRAHILWPNADAGIFNSTAKQQLTADTTCYSIRSYVVARDSKDSDSTHPTGYSTCQPSDRYQVKSAEIRVESPDR
jgi:hypothetical protein